MTPSEFKLWFEGYTEALEGLPTEAQWARIKERVAQIGLNQVTFRSGIGTAIGAIPGYGGNSIAVKDNATRVM